MNTETISINKKLSLEIIFYSAGGARCDIRFCKGGGYYSDEEAIEEEAVIDVQQAKEIIAALARFVNAVERKEDLEHRGEIQK